MSRSERVTAPKVEKVAREMYRILADSVSPKDREFVTDLARWHLREIAKAERRGRGKTVFYAMVDRDPLSGDWSPYGWTIDPPNARMTRLIGKCGGVRREVARVVLVRKPVAKRKRGAK